MEGGLWWEKDFGEVYIFNLIFYLDFKFLQYFDGELVLMFCIGFKKNGEVVFFMFWYMYLFDEDFNVVIVFLRLESLFICFFDKQWLE